MIPRHEAISRVAFALLNIRAAARPLGSFDGQSRNWLVDHGLATTADKGLWNFALTPIGDEIANHVEIYFSQLLTAFHDTGKVHNVHQKNDNDNDPDEQKGNDGEAKKEEPGGYIVVEGHRVSAAECIRQLWLRSYDRRATRGKGNRPATKK
jgi:hypothetical protein